MGDEDLGQTAFIDYTHTILVGNLCDMKAIQGDKLLMLIIGTIWTGRLGCEVTSDRPRQGEKTATACCIDSNNRGSTHITKV